MGRKWSDNFTANLASTINASAGTLTVSTGYGTLAPTIVGRGTAGACPDFIVLTLEDAAGNIEKIKCEAHAAASDVFGSGPYPLIRGYDGSTARSWTAGTTVNVDIRIDKSFLSDAQEKLLSVSTAFGIRDSATTSLTFGYFGGQLWVDGVLTTIANGSLTMTGSSVNYVERTAAGVVSSNTSGFTAGRYPMYEVTTSSTDITAIQDRRTGGEPLQGGLAKSVAGGVDVTLTAAEARNKLITITGVLTANINLIVPTIKDAWTLRNSTTGSYTVTVKPASGTGVLATQGKANLFFCDGTNVWKVDDVTGFEPIDATIARTGQVNAFNKAQRGVPVALTDAATIAIDLSLANNFVVQIGGNRTLGVPSSPSANQSGTITVLQDKTGSRTLAYSWPYVWANGSADVLSTTGLSEDQLVYEVSAYKAATASITIAAPGVVTMSGHGFYDGQRVQIATTGALPTGLAVNTAYFVEVIDANSFYLCTSKANVVAGSRITTTGSQSGVHTITGMTIKLSLNKAFG